MNLDRIFSETDDRKRYVDNLKEFQGVRQGDIYVIRLPNVSARSKLEEMLNATLNRYDSPNLKLGEVGAKTDNLQLVAGSSIGSRHCISQEDASVVTIYTPANNASQFEGPVIVADSRFEIVHPEHAPYSLPEGVYQVIYQRDARSNMKVQD